MARFSSFIFTERDSEVHRLGHKQIRSVCYSGEISVHTDCYRHGEGTKNSPYTESVLVWLDRGYGDYSDKFLSLCTVDEHGRVSLPSNLKEKVEEHNRKIEERLEKLARLSA